MRFLGMTVICLFTSLAAAANFSGQSEFTAFELRGRLSLTCSEGIRQDFKVVYCRGDMLTPFEVGYFNASKGLEASKLLLQSHQENGKVVEKTVDYDDNKGQSAKRVNLWINTLLQTALLDYGTNKVNYQLVSANEKVVESGELTIPVRDGGTRECAPGSMHSFTMSDCDFAENQCGRYFASHNYCE